MPLPISVIVVVKNAASTLEGSLTAIRANDPEEIIVIDGNSVDNSAEIVRKYTEHVYSDRGRGYTYALQLGAQLASQEYVAYVDADIILPVETLATMLSELEKTAYASICARILPADRSSYWARAMQHHVEWIMARRPGAGLYAALLRRSTILHHGFDLSIPGGGDYEFYARLRRKGQRFGLSSASVYHSHRLSLRGLANQKYRIGREKAHFLLRRGPFDPEIWPPLSAGYYTLQSLLIGRIDLVPYFLVSGAIETVGMLRELAAILVGGQHYSAGGPLE